MYQPSSKNNRAMMKPPMASLVELKVLPGSEGSAEMIDSAAVAVIL